MPFTYNGVGTRYHGHANSERRPAACHSCRRPAQLESYDTRLWFVVLFIPIIPLGRKRIIDQCPLCKRHYVVDADQWETQKQLNVSGAMEQYRADPTPENAMAAHQQLVNFHQTLDAAEFRRVIAEKFRQNAKLQAYLGLSLAGKGMSQDATLYFQRALELRPDLPEARVGVAREHIRTGKLAEARTLLDFLEKPGAAQLYSLEPLETLAYAFQQAGQDQAALELFQSLLTELPAIGEAPNFRRRVEISEKKLGKKESILPKKKFSWKRMFGGGPRQPRVPGTVRVTWRGLGKIALVLVILVGLFVVHAFYQSRHRRVFIVNGLGKPATVEVRGIGTVQVGGKNHIFEKLEMPEGSHHVSITGAIRQELDIDVRPGPGSNPLWVLNVDGAALLLEQRVTYSAHSAPPPEISAHFGQTFERIYGISHPFIPLPVSLQMKSYEQRVLTHLDFSPLSADQLLTWFQAKGRNGEAARLAEWQLRFHPDDANALALFAAMAPPKYAEEVLLKGLPRRPVEVQWHRTYQDLHSNPDWTAWLAVVYDGLLKEEPNNSTLLYLRGRVATAPGEAQTWFERARAADPQNPFSYYALGYDLADDGNWEAARPLFARAVELNPDGPGFADALFTARMALREYAPLEQEFRTAGARRPLDFDLKLRLIQLLLAQGRPTEAAKIVTVIQDEVRRNTNSPWAGALAMLVWQYDYGAERFADLEQSARKDRGVAGRNMLFTALIEQGKIAEALRIHPLDKAGAKEAYEVLVVALACLAAHDQPQADLWLQRAAQVFQNGTADEIRAGALLRKDAVLTPQAIHEAGIDPKGKAMLLATLGLLHPEQSKELFAAARGLNVDRTFPYHLVQRVTAATP